MPDLTLDEFRGFSEEELKRMLREEAIKAGFERTDSRFGQSVLIDPDRDRQPKGMGLEGCVVFLKRLCLFCMGR